MSANVAETYGWLALAANAAQAINGLGGASIGGFLCVTSGSLKITQTNTGGATVVDTMAVTAGVFYPIPAEVPQSIVLFATLTGGAAGTFFGNQR